MTRYTRLNENPESFQGTVTSEYTDFEWFYFDRWECKTTSGERFLFDFSILDVDASFLMMAKELFLTFCKVDLDGSLIASIWSQTRVAKLIKVLYLYMSEVEVARISSLNLEDYETIFYRLAIGDFDNEENVAFSSYVTVHSTLIAFREVYLSKKVSDGPGVVPTRDKVLEVAKRAIEDNGGDYVSWVQGNSWDGLPMSILILVVQEAISVIRSNETKYLMAYFRFQISLASHPINYIRSGKSIVLNPDRMFLIRLRGYFVFHYSGIRHHTKLLLDRLASCCGEVFGLKDDLGALTSDWPFRNCDEMRRWMQTVYEAGLIVFMAVTGARRGELESLLTSDLIKRKDGGYDFSSIIGKTNHGIPTIRSVAGVAAEVVDVLSILCFEDKKQDKIPLFCAPQGIFPMRDDRPEMRTPMTNACGSQHARHVIKRFVRLHLLPKYPELSSYLKDNRITPHRFRHAFAEFALRRFDGNVPELIRRHFRHHFGSFMTNMYNFGKLKVSESYTVEQMGINYLSELSVRYAQGEEELFGAVGRSIKKKVKELKFLSLDELKFELSSWVVSVFPGKIKPMEYGFCVLKYETTKQARCADKVTGVPNLDEACVTTCSGCVHLLSIDSQREDIIRIGQSVFEQQKTYQKLGIKPLIDACVEEVKSADLLLKMIGAGGSDESL